MIDVSELMTDPDFAQPFQILRSHGGEFTNEGEYQENRNQCINRVGVVQPAGKAALEKLPEGMRGNYIIDVHSAQELRCGVGFECKTSDIILWKSKRFRAILGVNFGDHGYWRILAQETTA